MKMKIKVMLLLLSTGFISITFLLKIAFPFTLSIFSNINFPDLSLTSLTQPSYLYILINCIILSIVASSKLHSPAAVDEAVKVVERDFEFVVPGAEAEAAVVEDVVEEVVKEVVFGYAPVKKVEKEEDVVVAPVAVAEKVEVEERMPYSGRFGHRKSVRGSPEGKTVLKKVSRPKRQETLESTWRTLTEGRSMPLTRHLRKSDTFIGSQHEASSPVHVMKKSDTFSYGGGGVGVGVESPSLGRDESLIGPQQEAGSPAHVMRKAETFSYGGGGVESPSQGSSGGKLRREASLSQDDLNRRVEAFIKKFNDEMRLQQLQSVRGH